MPRCYNRGFVLTFPLFIYRALLYLLAPMIRWHVYARAKAGKEDPSRLAERWGYSTAHPPARPLWIHAASVGEAASALAIIDLIRAIKPALPILITTGTVTSARVVAARLPANTWHQYAPYDHPVWVNRFLDHHRPLAAIRVEAEIWPVMLGAIKARSIPAIALNAWMSDRSFRRWRMIPHTIKTLLSTFETIIADGPTVATRLTSLGAINVQAGHNLKFLAAPLALNDTVREDLARQIGPRPTWLYASTHADEEMIAARIHQNLKKSFPTILTLIAPRHPDRRDAIRTSLTSTGLNIAWRSQGQHIIPDTDLYMVDTMGEMGMFYATIPVTVIGRSFSRDGGGGHNPIEPARLACYPLSGPQVQNLASIFTVMTDHHAAETLPDRAAITARLHHLLSHPDELDRCRHTAQDFTAHMATRTADDLRAILTPFLDRISP